MQGLGGVVTVKIFYFDSKGDEKPLEGFEENDVI